MKSRILTTLLALSAAAFLVAVYAPTADAQLCPQVITFAENPETGECVAFPTPCDVPAGWEECNGGGGVPMSREQPLDFAEPAADGELCIQVITFAEDPESGECVAFPTPCDVPEGWEDCGPGPIGF